MYQIYDTPWFFFFWLKKIIIKKKITKPPSTLFFYVLDFRLCVTFAVPAQDFLHRIELRLETAHKWNGRNKVFTTKSTLQKLFESTKIRESSKLCDESFSFKTLALHLKSLFFHWKYTCPGFESLFTFFKGFVLLFTPFKRPHVSSRV